MSDKANVPPAIIELQTMWGEFVKSVELKGFDAKLIITYKKEVFDGMTSRERTLVDGIVDMYLGASLQFKPKAPAMTEVEKKEEEAPEKAEENKPEEKPEVEANE